MAISIASRFDLKKLNDFKVTKGSKNQDETTPIVFLTPTPGKLRLNGMAMKELGVKKGGFLQMYDLGAKGDMPSRFIICRSEDVDGKNDGFKLGGHNYISASTLYNAMLLNKDGVSKITDDRMIEMGLMKEYPTVKDGIATGAVSKGATKVVQFDLEQWIVEDEDGNIVDKISPDPERGLEPVPMFFLVNRMEKDFDPGINIDEEDEDANDDI